MPLRPKYQVFISSTYGDLRQEREAVTWAILSSRLVPAGMENFTATDDRGWKTIKSVIDRSDYYVLILAGRYGSVDDDGLSWTEKEYNYAVSCGIPVLVFLRSKKSTTADRMEEAPAAARKLEKFKSKVRSSHLCQEWSTKEDLVGHVNNGLRNHIIDDEDGGRSRPGWYRGDDLPKNATLDEFARLSAENVRLQSELDSTLAMIKEKPRLALVGRDENLMLPKCSIERPFKIYNAGLESIDKLLSANYGREYLALNLLTIVELGIQNLSSALVEHVVIDLTLKPIRGFRCGWNGKELAAEGGRRSNSPIKAEFRFRYPDSARLVSNDTLNLRLRIPAVPAGGTEYLPELLVLGQVEQQRTFFNLSYKIAGSVGSAISGSIDFETVFEGTVQIAKRELDWEKNDREKKHGIYFPNDMFFA